MGIVVTIAMLLGLINFTPSVKQRINSRFKLFMGRLLLLAGLWNALWFGSRHWQVFWGQAALVSGVAMVSAALLILKEYKDPLIDSQQWLNSAYTLCERLKVFIVLVLLMSFLLYAVTLIRLNLGLAIIP